MKGLVVIGWDGFLAMTVAVGTLRWCRPLLWNIDLLAGHNSSSQSHKGNELGHFTLLANSVILDKWIMTTDSIAGMMDVIVVLLFYLLAFRILLHDD